jgi:tRNA (guanosine-2'-O-)-methyltransferase
MTETLINALKEHVTPERWNRFTSIVEERTRYITVVGEDIYQPHNMSAVLRTCDCFGIQDVHIIENRNAFEVNPEVSLGATQWLNIERYNKPDLENSQRCIRQLRSAGYAIVATSPHVDGYTAACLPLDRPVAILMGTEGRGLSDYLLEEADMKLRIPMYGFTESYNLSVSAAMIVHRLSESLRASDVAWQLTEKERLETLGQWLVKSIKKGEEVLASIKLRQGLS